MEEPFAFAVGVERREEKKDVCEVMDNVEGCAMFALPDDVDWFTGQAVLQGRGQVQIVVREEECENACLCGGGYGHYAMTLTDQEGRAECRVARTGGDCLVLEGRDASGFSFHADAVYSEARARNFVKKFFPNLERRTVERGDDDLVVNSGKIRAKQLCAFGASDIARMVLYGQRGSA